MSGACLLAFSPYAWNQQVAEWKLRVAVENAALRLKPDLNSQVVARVSKGTLLNSYEVEGAWFRVVLSPGLEGVTVVGYIATNEVEILEEKIKWPAEFWEEPPEEFHGLGLSLKLAAGLSFFSGGDFNRGAAGMFDSSADDIRSWGYTEESRAPRSLRSGFDVGGDIIYYLTTRIGIGLGMDYIHASADSAFMFRGNDLVTIKMYSTPWFNGYCPRLGLFYDLPVNRWLALSFSGGPALFFVKYNYNRNVFAPPVAEDFYQQAKAVGIGLQGGLGLALHLNPRVAVFLEAQGRFAKISGFEGSEKVSHEVNGWPNIREARGTLYLVERYRYPELSVLADGDTGVQNASKAVLDLTGVTFLAGLRLRF